ncbi:hypothetical protein INT43_008785 [Umbelopsis isabellina]|uniref:Uncharacterized protein n=1 Tax=Mortierella isabellina TaxID=91625 RepID=A0A8H7PVW1_MORIS|nr:hypothetical protein INT43_008785 [Umbelopsis isabellina]
MSATQDPVAEPFTTSEVPTETPAPEVVDAIPASNEVSETQPEVAADTQAEAQPEAEAEAAVKEPAKVVKRKSIFNPFGRRKEEPKKEETKQEEQAEIVLTETAAEAPTPTKSADEPTVTKRKSKGFNFFTRKTSSPQTKTEEPASEPTNTELPKIEHLEPIQPETIVNQVDSSTEAPKAVEEPKVPNRSSSPFGKRLTNIFKFSKSNDKSEKDTAAKDDVVATEDQAKQEQVEEAESNDKPLPEVTATSEEADKTLPAAPPVSASA